MTLIEQTRQKEVLVTYNWPAQARLGPTTPGLLRFGYNC